MDGNSIEVDGAEREHLAFDVDSELVLSYLCYEEVEVNGAVHFG